MNASPEIVTVELHCHAYPWHIVDDDYPECGPENLIRFAETYGVMVRTVGCFGPHGAWVYKATGTPENLIRFMADEYTDVDSAREEVAYYIEKATK